MPGWTLHRVEILYWLLIGLKWVIHLAKQEIKSPFYRIDTLELGNNVRIFYEGQWYDYTVSKKYEVPDNALYIESTSVEPKLTLYSCSMRGPAAGRYVIEASPNTTR